MSSWKLLLTAGVSSSGASLVLDLTLRFQVFTEEQISTLTTIRKAYTSAFSVQHDYLTTHAQPPLMPFMWDLSSPGSSYGSLAREFGLPENVVHALAQRLNGFR